MDGASDSSRVRHLLSVVHIAKEFRGRALPLEDVIAEGCVGLIKAIRRYRPAPLRVLHLDAPKRVDGGLRLAECLPHQAPPTGDTVIERDQIRRVRREVLRLAPRERAVIGWRCGLDGGAPKKLVEIAQRLGLSKERVRQIEASALGRLRGGMRTGRSIA